MFVTLPADKKVSTCVKNPWNNLKNNCSFFSNTLLYAYSFFLVSEQTLVLSSCCVDHRQSSCSNTELCNTKMSIHIHDADFWCAESNVMFDKEPWSVLPHIQLRSVLQNRELWLALGPGRLLLCHLHTSRVRSIPRRNKCHLKERMHNTE